MQFLCTQLYQTMDYGVRSAVQHIYPPLPVDCLAYKYIVGRCVFFNIYFNNFAPTFLIPLQRPTQLTPSV